MKLKKIASLGATLVLSFSLAACGGGNSDEDSKSSEPTSSSSPDEASSEEENDTTSPNGEDVAPDGDPLTEEPEDAEPSAADPIPPTKKEIAAFFATGFSSMTDTLPKNQQARFEELVGSVSDCVADALVKVEFSPEGNAVIKSKDIEGDLSTEDQQAMAAVAEELDECMKPLQELINS